MRHEENYCVWSSSSIGGCPLEEASEQERIPSIIGSIVWCCPTSRVLIIIECGFFYIALWIYCVFSICGDYISDLFRYLTSGIRALSRAGVVGNYFLFLQIFFFFSEKKKEGRDIPDIFSIFLCKICRKGLYI
jgi:hypothetical protein